MLAGLDQAVDEAGAVGLGRLQPVDDAEDHQGGQALGRRWQVVEGGAREAHRHRFDQPRPMVGHILAADRAAGGLEFGGDHGGEFAPVKIVGAGGGEALQGLGQGRLDHGRAGGRRLATRQIDPAEAGLGQQLLGVLGEQGGAASRHRHAVAGVPDRVFEQTGQRQAAAPAPADREGRRPTRDHAGDGVGGQRSARGNFGKAAGAVKIGRNRPSGGPRRLDGHGRLAGFVNEPIGVAAEPVEVGCHHGGGGRGRDHRLDGVAALAQHRKPGLGRQMMGRHHHPSSRVGRFQHRVHAPPVTAGDLRRLSGAGNRGDGFCSRVVLFPARNWYGGGRGLFQVARNSGVPQVNPR